MAEFQWWLLLVGLVAGGGLVLVVTMDGRRREDDIEALERQAETGWIAERLAGTAAWVDPPTVDAVLRLHREYLGLPPPDEIVVIAEPLAPEASDGDPDRMPDDVGDDRGGRTDQDLAEPRVEEAPAGQEAYAGADREQRADR